MASKRSQNSVTPLKRQRKTDKTNGSIRREYFSNSFKNAFHEAYIAHSGKQFDGSEVEIIKEPFTCSILPNFLEEDSFTGQLIEELTDLTLYEKNNDLYKFQQSEDLKNVNGPALKTLKDLLYGEFRCWLQEMTGIMLNDTVDMNCSKYEYTDVLLCHDDELEGRRIAFILYLVNPSWCEKDGGTLDLFNTDENCQPKEVVKSLVPRRNNLVFFEVTPTSFHQVSEVLTEDRYRLSVSGWFHGSPFERPVPYLEPAEKFEDPGHVSEELLRAWINPTYLETDVQMQVQEKFQADSEIELQGFLEDKKYKLLAETLKQQELIWKMTGPANKRHFEEAQKTNLPDVVQEFLQVLGSEAMFLVLSNITGLRLHSLATKESDSDDEDEKAKDGPCTPKWHASIRRWTHGCYTLIHDHDKHLSETALDATFYFNCQDWAPECGGYTSYIAKGEDEELLSVSPSSNALALVYRDPETLNFVKHVNNKVTERTKDNQAFQDVFCVYYE